MRILRPTLIGLTLGLSVVSVYLATVVAEEHTRAEDVAQQRRQVALRLQRFTRPEAGAAPVTDAPAPAGQAPITAPQPAADEEEEPGTWNFATHADRLREITNPTLRAALRIQGREEQRAQHPRLATELRLSASEADELFTSLAEQNLRYEERYHRNRIAGRREYIDFMQLDTIAQEELKALLGPQRFRAFLDYRNVLPERRRINSLNERLDRADRFTTQETNQLAQVMRSERAAFEDELRQLPGVVRFTAGAPEDARLRGVDDEAEQRFGVNQVARIQALHARIRERASSFLTPAQLHRLRQQQDERVASVQLDYLWERYVGPAQEAMEAAGEARQKK